MVFGSFTENIFISRVNKNIIHPYWDIAENKELSNTPGLLVDTFGTFARDPKIDEALKILIKKNHPDTVDNVFTHAAANIPILDLEKMAGHLAQSPAFRTLSDILTNIAINAVTKICSRSRNNQVPKIFSILDQNNALNFLFSKTSNHLIVNLFLDIVGGMPTEDAIKFLKSLDAWNRLDHYNGPGSGASIYEWLESHSPQLRDAMNL